MTDMNGDAPVELPADAQLRALMGELSIAVRAACPEQYRAILIVFDTMTGHYSFCWDAQCPVDAVIYALAGLIQRLTKQLMQPPEAVAH